MNKCAWALLETRLVNPPTPRSDIINPPTRRSKTPKEPPPKELPRCAWVEKDAKWTLRTCVGSESASLVREVRGDHSTAQGRETIVPCSGWWWRCCGVSAKEGFIQTTFGRRGISLEGEVCGLREYGVVFGSPSTWVWGGNGIVFYRVDEQSGRYIIIL